MGFLTQDPDLVVSARLSVFIFVVGVLECMVYGGAVFGWPQLVHILKVEGIYADLCSHDANGTSFGNATAPAGGVLALGKDWCSLKDDLKTNESLGLDDVEYGSCPEQDQRFALIYTIAICCFGLPGIMVGYLLHYVGLMVSRITAAAMLGLGFFFLGIATKESPDWLFPAMILMAFGGNQIRMCVMQFGDLFPKFRSAGITLLSGVYSVSASLFLVFQIATWMGLSRSNFCFFFTGLACVSILCSFAMPVHHIPILEDYYKKDRTPVQKKLPLPLRKSVLSPSFFLLQYWLFISLFALNNFQQNFNVWITETSCSTSEAEWFSALFSYSNFFTIFIIPLFGFFTDYMVSRASKEASDELTFRMKEIQASFWPLFITSLAITGMYCGLFLFRAGAVYFSLVCLVVVRPSVLAVTTSHVRIRFPADHLNRIMGILITFKASLAFLQYPHFYWSQSMYYTAHALIVILILLSYLDPLHLLVTPLMRRAVIIRDQMNQDGTPRRRFSQDVNDVTMAPMLKQDGQSD